MMMVHTHTHTHTHTPTHTHTHRPSHHTPSHHAHTPSHHTHHHITHTLTVVSLSVGQIDYTVAESAGQVDLSYVLTGQAIRPVLFDVTNIDGSATGGGIGECMV